MEISEEKGKGERGNSELGNGEMKDGEMGNGKLKKLLQIRFFPGWVVVEQFLLISFHVEKNR